MSNAIAIGYECSCGPCRVFVKALEQEHIANYHAFLATKAIKADSAGRETPLGAIDSRL